MVMCVCVCVCAKVCECVWVRTLACAHNVYCVFMLRLCALVSATNRIRVSARVGVVLDFGLGQRFRTWFGLGFGSELG